MADVQNKSIIIVGLGREGLATVHYFLEQNPNQVLAVADQKLLKDLPVDFGELLKKYPRIVSHLGPDYLSHLQQYDVVIKSAGIPLKLIKPYLGKAIVSSPTQLFFDACKGTIIGVTGTKGKSTTASVIYAVLENAGKNTVLCGNIGVPALDLLPQIKSQTLVVMELSSHQLQTLTKSPSIAVLLNIVPEHLDYYESFDDYVLAKENITRFQASGNLLLYNAAFPIPYEIAQRSKAKRVPFNADLGGQMSVYDKNDVIIFKENGHEEPIVLTSDLKLPGVFNYQNVMPAIIIGKLFGIDTQAIGQSLKTFRGLPDRLEFVGNIDGIDYYNDSLSTVPEALIAALEALGGRVQTVIAGGFDRGLDFSGLADYLVKSRVENLILFPTTGQKIWKAIEIATDHKLRTINCSFVATMKEAVATAKQKTSQNKICLLSPASPSFGIFKDYHDRGEQFKHFVLASQQV